MTYSNPNSVITLPPLPSGYGEINDKKPVFGASGTYHFQDGDDYLELGSPSSLQLNSGTYVLNFTAYQVSGWHALFSKDAYGLGGGGQMTVFLHNGKVGVVMENPEEYTYFEANSAPVSANADHHLAVTFGAEGIKLYVDGLLAAADPRFKQSMLNNKEGLVLGAGGWSRGDITESPNDKFAGTISNFAVYDTVLTEEDIAEISGAEHSHHAQMHLAVEDMMPVFAQHHAATDFLKSVATQFGYTHADSMSKMVEVGSAGNDSMTGDDTTQIYNGGVGNDALSGAGGADELQGYYGNDSLNGGEGNDLLDGGYGEDNLNGGEGNDVLVSRADGGEGAIAVIPGRSQRDPYHELDDATGKLYSNQPLESDDTLTGGAGADRFYFQTLINAKQRFIEKHTNEDGTIEWHNVAGENTNLHDHWVDVIGNDVITDFNRAEGDRIIIEGHTTEILRIDYADSNSDGVNDYSIIRLYSNQGSGGGAHNRDLLGKIVVYGDLINSADYTQTAAPAYGIVNSVNDLAEAITPLNSYSTHAPAIPSVVVRGTVAEDVLQAGEGKDTVYGFAGNDRLYGNKGDDWVHGGNDNDRLYGEHGDDTLQGSQGNDTLEGSYGEDVLRGGTGGDRLFGNDGNDTLYGDNDDDRLFGDAGQDVLVGGMGKDILTGGSGRDYFTFEGATQSVKTGNMMDGIVDFLDGTDRIALKGMGFSAIDLDGGRTESGELRISYSAASDRTYVLNDQNDFAFYLAGDYTAVLTHGDFIFM